MHDWIYAAAGIHPHEARHATEAHYAELQRLALNPRVIAWGEIGLDFHYDHSPPMYRPAYFATNSVRRERRANR
jgi:TatD DNase family protein